MEHVLDLEILPQPDDVTCGPTCLHAVYRYYGQAPPLPEIIAQVPMLEGGGTLAVSLACHALQRGFRARIYTYDLHLFDPTWFRTPGVDLRERLRTQLMAKPDNVRLKRDSEAVLQFLALGGELRFQELTTELILGYLKRKRPILTGLSSTYLYMCAREFNEDFDDLRGEPAGHFVVLGGYDRERHEVMVWDPLFDNPTFNAHRYSVPVGRVLGAILLGVLTHDSNLLIIEPPPGT